MDVNCVLVVDDSAADQFITKRLLATFDSSIAVLQAYDGDEALRLLDTLAKSPDLILLDINMPAMNGHEFLEEYTSREMQAAVVVMLTSSDQESDRERALAHKCVRRYIIKPLEVSDLEALLAAVGEQTSPSD